MSAEPPQSPFPALTSAGPEAASAILERLLASLDEAVFVVHPATRRLSHWNAAAERLFGYSAAEIAAQPDTRFLHVDDAHFERFGRELAAALAAQGFFAGELELRRRDGAAFTAQYLVQPLTARPGEAPVRLTMVRDLSMRRQAEAELREGEARFQLLFANHPHPMWVYDRETLAILEVNDAALAQYGYSRAEFLQLTIADLRPPEELERLRAHVHQPRPALQASGEWRHRRRDGSELPVEITSHTLTFAGRPAALVVAQDVTVRRQAEAARQTAETRFRELAETIQEVFWVVEAATGRVIYVSPAYERVWGRPCAEVYTNPNAFVAAILPEDRLQVEAAYTRQIHGERTSVEYRLRGPDGALRWVWDQGFPVFDAAGHVVRLTGLAADITTRKQAELAQQASAELYHSLLASLESAVAVCAADGQLLYLNDVAARQLGGGSADFVGRRLSEFVTTPRSGQLLADLQSVLAADQGRTTELEAVVQGRPRWYRLHLQPIHDAQGRAVQVLVNTTDITEFRGAQRELEMLNRTLEQRVAERAAEVQDLYENAPCGYHSLDAAGVFVRLNQTALNWLGYTRAEVLGRLKFTDLLTPAGRQLFAERFPLFKQRGVMRDLEFDLVRRDGSLLPVSLSATAIYDPQGGYVMDRGTLFDITERRQRQEALSAANHALAHAAQLKDEFLSTMSHELRTPLNAILSLAESLDEGVYGPLEPAQTRTLQLIAESGQHLLELINDVLDLSKIEAGRMDWASAPVDVRGVCQAALRLVRQQAAQKQLRVTLSLDGSVTQVAADERRLKQMLVNLLSNAVKFTPPGGEVGLDVHGSAADEILHFTVWDTGIGIPAEKLGLLFQPFTQVDSGLAREYPGTGLGLALVRRLAELHGGGVAVTSTPGQGSRFSLRLPGRLPAAAPSLPEPDLRLPPACRVLVADDNAASRRSLGALVEAAGGQALLAADGPQALELAGANRPDLILMDIRLPGLSGLDAIRQLRAQAAFTHTPILAITALAMPHDQAECLAAGATAYLTKPVNRRELLQTIRRALQR